ncbi:MAG: nucleotidyltransferase [Clostridia bacterium]|nr:nucleotidyltransferase [Clostridia bacterium]
MKISAIICEYNPFHKGHKFHIEKTKELTGSDYSVALMSGNFVQRGEVAVFDKYERAKAAINCGADLVLQLPTPYSLSSAEFFAGGAVKILNRLNVITHLSFGSECGDINLIRDTAKKLLSEEVQSKIKENMKTGIPVFKAIENASGSEILSSPNNILAVEYLKALIKEKSSIIPVTLKREGDYHSESTDEIFSSATAIRSIIHENDYSQLVPEEAYEIFKNHTPRSEKIIESAIIYSLRVKKPSDLLKYPDVSEGLENAIINAANKFDTLEDIIMAVKTKRYSYTRIRRIIYNIFLDIDKSLRSAEPEYVKVLDFNEKGREILREIKENSQIPAIANVNKNMYEKYVMLNEEKKYDNILQFFYK